MLILRLETLDRVCLGIDCNEHDNLKYDVTCDVLGLPYLPMYRLLGERMEFPEGLRLGLGRPEYYEGLIAGLRMLNNYEGISPQLVLDCFTEICKTARGELCRVLKKGQAFFATVHLDEDRLQDFRAALAGITTLGYTDENIPGRVSISVLRYAPEKAARSFPTPELSPDKQYAGLTYQVQTVSPLCVFSPFDAKNKCKNYLPGEVLLDFIRDHIGEFDDGGFGSGKLRVANAYPVAEDKRGIPAPAAMVLHKLDKSALEYRLAPLPPDNAYVAISQIGGQFVARPREKTVVRFEPDEVKIYPQILDSNLAGTSTARSALAEGQVLQGFINGSDRQIRALVKLFSKYPVFSLGSCTAEGYGEVMFRFLRLQESLNPGAQLADEFDVLCLAPVLLFDDRGMARYDAESLKQAIERRLNAVGKLEIVKSFMQSTVCYRLDRRLPQDTAQNMCVQMGSSLRLRTRDGKPVDIAPLIHGFLGDRRREGYGEVLVYPAGDAYTRCCEEVRTEVFRLSRPGGVREVQVAAQFIQDVLKTLLRMKVSLLALSDRGDHPIDPENSMEVLRTMRDRYASSVSDEELLEMYREVADRDI